MSVVINSATLVAAIGTVLREEMRHPHLDRFGPQARLNEDLYLDSVQLLQLILALEMTHGVSVPEAAINRQDVSTVADLARILAPGAEPAAPVAAEPQAPSEGVHGPTMPWPSSHRARFRRLPSSPSPVR